MPLDSRDIDLTPPQVAQVSEADMELMRYLIDNFARIQELVSIFDSDGKLEKHIYTDGNYLIASKDDGTIGGFVAYNERLSQGILVAGSRDLIALNDPVMFAGNVILSHGDTLYLSFNSAIENGYLKLGPATTFPGLSNTYYPLQAVQLETSSHIQTATDNNSYDLTDELSHEIVGCRITADINYSTSARGEFHCVLDDTAGRGSHVNIQFLINGSPVEQSAEYYITERVPIDLNKMLPAPYPVIGDTFSVEMTAIKAHVNSNPVVEAGATLTLTQPVIG